MLGGTPVYTESCYLFFSNEFFFTLLLCCVQMSSKLGKIRVGKSKLSQSFPSSEEIEALHESDGVLSSEEKNNEGLRTEVPELVEHDAEKLPKRGFLKRILVWGFFGFKKNPDVDQHYCVNVELMS